MKFSFNIRSTNVGMSNNKEFFNLSRFKPKVFNENIYFHWIIIDP